MNPYKRAAFSTALYMKFRIFRDLLSILIPFFLPTFPHFAWKYGKQKDSLYKSHGVYHRLSTMENSCFLF